MGRPVRALCVGRPRRAGRVPLGRLLRRRRARGAARRLGPSHHGHVRHRARGLVRSRVHCGRLLDTGASSATSRGSGSDASAHRVQARSGGCRGTFSVCYARGGPRCRDSFAGEHDMAPTRKSPVGILLSHAYTLRSAGHPGALLGCDAALLAALAPLSLRDGPRACGLPQVRAKSGLLGCVGGTALPVPLFCCL